MNTTKIITLAIILLFGTIVFNLFQINKLNKKIDELTDKTNIQEKKIKILKIDFEDIKEEVKENNEFKFKKIRSIEFETELNKNEQELRNNIIQDQINDIENEQY